MSLVDVKARIMYGYYPYTVICRQGYNYLDTLATHTVTHINIIIIKSEAKAGWPLTPRYHCQMTLKKTFGAITIYSR